MSSAHYCGVHQEVRPGLGVYVRLGTTTVTVVWMTTAGSVKLVQL
eukprot:COSAG05_NODE_9207_length_640_cov_0.475046_2_plen_44_part_01